MAIQQQTQQSLPFARCLLQPAMRPFRSRQRPNGHCSAITSGPFAETPEQSLHCSVADEPQTLPSTPPPTRGISPEFVEFWLDASKGLRRRQSAAIPEIPYVDQLLYHSDVAAASELGKEREQTSTNFATRRYRSIAVVPLFG